MNFKKIAVMFILFCLVLSQNAMARRMGGGGSYGMQRSMSRPNYSNTYQPQYAQPQPSMNQGAAPQRQGMGAGTAAALGAAAGAAGGYMLGRSMANNNGVAQNDMANASGVVQQQTSEMPAANTSKMPWGIIAILVLLLVFGLMFFRKKISPDMPIGRMNNQGFNSGNTFNSSTNQSQSVNYAPQGNYGAPNQPAMVQPTKMPDGVEAVYFLRQVKGMFLHIQSMNNRDNLAEVEKYMTSQLYQELKDSIANNGAVADFTNLDCQLLDSAVEGNNQLVASVKFFGLVSDEPNQAPQPFSEIWNFVKSDLTYGKWLVAGIQQETLN